jgi:hypothetical protein
MTQAHELKCWPDSFEAIAGGFKAFELRKDDRGYRVGDYLLLREWNPTPVVTPSVVIDLVPVRRQYTGRNMMCVITYILRQGDAFGAFLAEKDTVVLSIKLLARGKDKDVEEAGDGQAE